LLERIVCAGIGFLVGLAVYAWSPPFIYPVIIRNAGPIRLDSRDESREYWLPPDVVLYPTSHGGVESFVRYSLYVNMDGGATGEPVRASQPFMISPLSGYMPEM